MLFKDEYKHTAWHKVRRSGNAEVLEKLCNWAEELHLKPEELRNNLFCEIWPVGRAILTDHIALLANLRE
jgi:hypothetical protein